MDTGDLEGSSTDLQEVNDREVSAGKRVNAPGARFVLMVGGEEGGERDSQFRFTSSLLGVRHIFCCPEHSARNRPLPFT